MPDEDSLSTIAPGWYDDGTGTNSIRWWDGSAWTELVSAGPARRRLSRRALALIVASASLLALLALFALFALGVTS